MEYKEGLIFFDEDDLWLSELPDDGVPVEESFELLVLVNEEKMELQQELGQLVLWGVEGTTYKDENIPILHDRLLSLLRIQAQLNEIVVPLLIDDFISAANQAR